MLLDGGCFSGHDVETGFCYPIEKVLADFDRHGVAKGLVGSYRCLYQDLVGGNRETAHWAAEFPDRIIPLGILHPSFYGQSPEQLLTWLRHELGFQVVGLFNVPAYYPVEWSGPGVRRLGESAGKLGMALQVGIRTEAELAGVARSLGGLSVSVLIRWMAGHHYKMLAAEMAVAAQYPNFTFDVGNLASTGAMEHLANVIGADRLFLASNSPHNIPQCAHAIFQDAQLTLHQRNLIGGETLCRILGLAPVPQAESIAPEGDAKWRQLGARPKVDIHWHQDHWNLGEPRLCEVEQLATFDRYGYERVIVSSILALNYDLEAGNEVTLNWFDKDPRVFGMIVINPLQREASISQIERYAEHPRFVGLKTIQDLFGIGLDDPLYEPILTRAAEKQLPVLAHIPGMEIAARRHPEINFIAAHANWVRAQRLIDLPNVYFDFATGHALRHETQLARFVCAVGATRVLFGSDGQLVSPSWSLAKLSDACLQAKDEALILRENAYRLFPGLKESSS